MASRMAAAAVIVVWALLTWTPEAARLLGKRSEVALAVAGHANAAYGGITGNVHWKQQQRELFIIGRRPRLASFTRRDVAPPAVGGAGGRKREVPGGPDPIHHPDLLPASPANP
jgi:hypothetical protein